jgi:alpha-tubulin suppressor-like RCC1 family protein
MIAARRRIKWPIALATVAGPLLLAACGHDSPTSLAGGSQLAFLTPVSPAAEGQVAIDPPVRVAIQDAAGNTVDATADVTLALATSVSGATLAGTTTVRAVHGIATFADLSVDVLGDGFVLEARADGVPAATSTAFAVHLSFGQVTVGQVHSCAITTAGYAYCWGNNSSGQLGNGSHDDHHAPWPVRGRLKFRQISAGPHHTCGATLSDSAYCWGGNVNGILGDGTTNERQEPTLVNGGVQFYAVQTGANHSCGLTEFGEVYCWGVTFGENSVFVRYTPTLVTGGPAFMRIAVGHSHTCGWTIYGVGYCWGANGGGQLGDSTATGRTTPGLVAGGLNFIQISAGYGYTCGVSTTNVGYCWGFSADGALGDGTTSSSHLSPTPTSGGLTFATMSAGDFWHSCGVTTSNAAYCWGHGAEGQLGDGTMSQQLGPVAVAGNMTFVQVDAGVYHTCGVTTDHLAYCWGSNDYGVLGDGTIVASGTPRLVAH